jgi:ADP-heptose:LPS heptosyltransferase
MIVIAPFSNDALRDWPRAHFTQLIEMLITRTAHKISLIGSAEQRQAINLLVRGLSPQRLENMAGQWGWSQTLEQLAGADLIIANNSGIAHVGAAMGRPTLCLFAASHDPHEWGPRGPHVTTLYVRTACAPCGMSTQLGCAFGHACMRQLTPDIALKAAERLLRADSQDARAA